MRRRDLFALLSTAAVPVLRADEADRWTVRDTQPFAQSYRLTGGSNPRRVLVDNVWGDIRVTGVDGDAVQLKAERRTKAESREALAEGGRDIKLDINQQGNFLRVFVDGPFRHGGGINYRGDRYYGYRVEYDFELQVPRDAEVVLKTIHDKVTVQNVDGDYDVSVVNGGIKLLNAGGAGRAHTVNGSMEVRYRRNPAKPCSFKTINGGVDVWFQPGLAADLRFKTMHGEFYTDFPVEPRALATSETRREGSKWIYRSERGTGARTGGGGPELSFETLNGSVRLRQAG